MAGLGGAAPASVVKVDVTHAGLQRRFVQIRLDLHASILGVKQELQQRTGTSASAMHLALYDAQDRLVADALEDHRPLGFYSVADGFRLHVVDADPASLASRGWLEDTSLVAKYEISEDKYNARNDSARKFKERLFEMRPDLVPQQGLSPDHMADLASAIRVGQRCQVDPGERRGEVQHVGPVRELPPGHWVGVALDEPAGKHDGSVGGTRYFQCPPGHGVFLRPDRVQVGDYPERDPFDEEEPDEI